MKKLLIVPILCLIAYAAYAITVPFVITVGTGDLPFTLPTGSVLHFMAPASASPAGNDTNSGLDPAHPWRTPNHAMKCGEVILAQPGTYTAIGGAFAAVSNCPSTTGGIDGTGGIYFAVVLCAGASVGDCLVNSTTDEAFAPATNNWAVSGWASTSGTGTPGAAAHTMFMPDPGGPIAQLKYLALINSISYDNGQGFGSNNRNHPTIGTDYMASIGVIYQNSNQNDICLAALDAVGVGGTDSNPGTHIYFYTNYLMNNAVPDSHACGPSGVSHIDAEAMMFDSLETGGFNGTAVAANNLSYIATRYGMQLFYDPTLVTAKVYNNTFFSHMKNGGGTMGEINLQYKTGTNGGSVQIYNNIAYSDHAHSTTGVSDNYALLVSTQYTGVSIGAQVGTGKENIFKGSYTSCDEVIANACDPGFNVIGFHFGNLWGLNTYVNPTFNNTTDLLANRIGVPSCSGFSNTTQCMGYDARTNTLTNPSVIYDLQATCAQCTGKGFQLPSTTCAANADYPAYLKGVVYLQASGYASGATITEKAGLVSKPCNM